MTENTDHRRFYLKPAGKAGLDAAEARNRELCAQRWDPADMAGEIIRAFLDASRKAGECPICGDDCSARTIRLPDGSVADCG
jgi:hypothetical protein